MGSQYPRPWWGAECALEPDPGVGGHSPEGQQETPPHLTAWVGQQPPSLSLPLQWPPGLPRPLSCHQTSNPLPHSPASSLSSQQGWVPLEVSVLQRAPVLPDSPPTFCWVSCSMTPALDESRPEPGPPPVLHAPTCFCSPPSSAAPPRLASLPCPISTHISSGRGPFPKACFLGVDSKQTQTCIVYETLTKSRTSSSKQKNGWRCSGPRTQTREVRPASPMRHWGEAAGGRPRGLRAL